MVKKHDINTAACIKTQLLAKDRVFKSTSGFAVWNSSQFSHVMWMSIPRNYFWWLNICACRPQMRIFRDKYACSNGKYMSNRTLLCLGRAHALGCSCYDCITRCLAFLVMIPILTCFSTDLLLLSDSGIRLDGGSWGYKCRRGTLALQQPTL